MFERILIDGALKEDVQDAGKPDKYGNNLVVSLLQLEECVCLSFFFFRLLRPQLSKKFSKNESAEPRCRGIVQLMLHKNFLCTLSAKVIATFVQLAHIF